MAGTTATANGRSAGGAKKKLSDQVRERETLM